MSFRVGLLTFCMITLSAASGFAGIMISYSGGAISAGGIGFVDVLISSNADALTPDNLDFFSAHFQLTPVGGAVAGGLQFVDPQGESQLGNGGYVFNLDSLGEDGFVPLGAVSTLVNLNDQYIAGDGTVSGIGIDLYDTSGSFLLFRLDLDASLATAGDQYTLALVDDLNTDFVSDLDNGFTSHTLATGSFDNFTITATGTAAVPEPSTLGFLVVGAAGVVARRYRRSRAVRTS